ncbi:GIY-YIG nuclease family protein [Paenibacillus agilis]|nr:GIY-YIG nuclease family protein [Paenibacillus agilis]
MSSLYLSDILLRLNKAIIGLDIKRIKLLRHSFNSSAFKQCFEKDLLNEYQSIQKSGFFKNCDYIASFVSGPSSSAKFYGFYKVIDQTGRKAVPFELGAGFNPLNITEDDNFYNFKLEKTKHLSDLEGRLIINWGKATISWNQWATNEKEVLAIQEYEKYTFKGYENIVLEFSSLKEVVADPVLYESWHKALRSVYAIYLIVDCISGKQYVGSAYGEGGLLQRWRTYVETKHGNNVLMIKHLESNPAAFNHFQFSVLQIIPKNATADEVIALENLYKTKLQTRKFGLNDN